MPLPTLRCAGVATAAAAMTLVVSSSAHAAGAIFGGSTKDGEAIVLKADKRAKKLKSAVVSWVARCDDGRRFPVAVEVSAVRAEPGFDPEPLDLMMSRNAKGRFAGTQVAGRGLGEQAAIVSVKLAGRLGARRASGSLVADVTIFDTASGEQRNACRTGTLSWSATRAPGRVFGGSTSQGQPVVVRLDARRRNVADLLLGWHSSSCEPPESFLRFGERFADFPIKAGRFGDAFEQSFDGPDGFKTKYAYDVNGTVARRSARGTLRVNVTETDAAGAQTMSCDSGGISWRAATG